MYESDGKSALSVELSNEVLAEISSVSKKGDGNKGKHTALIDANIVSYNALLKNTMRDLFVKIGTEDIILVAMAVKFSKLEFKSGLYDFTDINELYEFDYENLDMVMIYTSSMLVVAELSEIEKRAISQFIDHFWYHYPKDIDKIEFRYESVVSINNDADNLYSNEKEVEIHFKDTELMEEISNKYFI